ncbi:XisH family protein [Calothrix sp. CCY 0018]|uniref:XisH family protein n=1 Tax=Calothrix sp. CCY 0018 TaxID=3103864 RepID=UPI0039C6EB62
MPSKDIIHDAVKNALIKDGWTITADPYTIKYEEIKLFADLAAQRPLLAERSGEKIVVEVKSFTGASFIQDLEKALGQYIIYRNLLTETVPDYDLYLAINERTYINFFQRKATQFIVQQNKMNLVIVDIANEVIIQWIK